MTKCNCDPDGCCKPKAPKASSYKSCDHQNEYNKICDSRIHGENSTDDDPTQFIIVDKGNGEYCAEPVPAIPTLQERQTVALEKIACRLKTMLKNTDFKRPKVRSTYKWKDYTSKKFKTKNHNDYTEKWTQDKKDESKAGCGC